LQRFFIEHLADYLIEADAVGDPVETGRRSRLSVRPHARYSALPCHFEARPELKELPK
jgi:hypothetical protein